MILSCIGCNRRLLVSAKKWSDARPSLPLLSSFPMFARCLPQGGHSTLVAASIVILVRYPVLCCSSGRFLRYSVQNIVHSFELLRFGFKAVARDLYRPSRVISTPHVIARLYFLCVDWLRVSAFHFVVHVFDQSQLHPHSVHRLFPTYIYGLGQIRWI